MNTKEAVLKFVNNFNEVFPTIKYAIDWRTDMLFMKKSLQVLEKKSWNFSDAINSFLINNLRHPQNAKTIAFWYFVKEREPIFKNV